MTKEQVQESSQKKVNAITTLAKQLEVVISAEQMITDQGFIKHVVYYTDTEKYDIDEQPKTDKKDEPKKDDVQPSEGEPKPNEEGAKPAGEKVPE